MVIWGSRRPQENTPDFVAEGRRGEHEVRQGGEVAMQHTEECMARASTKTLLIPDPSICTEARGRGEGEMEGWGGGGGLRVL